MEKDINFKFTTLKVSAPSWIFIHTMVEPKMKKLQAFSVTII